MLCYIVNHNPMVGYNSTIYSYMCRKRETTRNNGQITNINIKYLYFIISETK